MMHSGIQILIVEPNSPYSAKMRESIESRIPGVTITFESDAQRALNLLENQLYDCVIVDQQPLAMDGLKFLELFRRHSIDMPVIMIADQMSEQFASEAINFGVSEYLVKEGSFHLILPRVILESIRRQTLVRRNRELEERLRESENISAINLAAATLAHEINNPLTTIIGVSELLNSDSALTDTKTAKRKLRLITNSAERIRNALSTMSRLSNPAIQQTVAGPIIAKHAVSSKKTKI